MAVHFTKIGKLGAARIGFLGFGAKVILDELMMFEDWVCLL